MLMTTFNSPGQLNTMNTFYTPVQSRAAEEALTTINYLNANLLIHITFIHKGYRLLQTTEHIVVHFIFYNPKVK